MSDPGKELLKLLDTLEDSPQFCASGCLDPVLPGLEIGGVGTVGLPISAAVVRQLIEHAAQAPYGRGEETILDTNVRRVWQIEPHQFQLKNPAWDRFVAHIVTAVRLEFSINHEVKHDLYKLLIYEKGSFFAPHRDTEKLEGMFATLVVGLPSRHEGGALVVTHHGQTQKIDFGGPPGEFQVQFAAFYADCRHEIRPVTDGYRVCLVYNLALAGRQRQPHAPRSGEKVDRAAELIAEWFADASRNKVVIPLKHEYTEASLNFEALKGQDRSSVQLLHRAAEQAGCDIYLALLKWRQSGGADYSGYAFDDDEDSIEIDEVTEEVITLEDLIDPQGGAPLEFLNLEIDEILTAKGLEELPFEQEVQEATGNAGATVERWYHQAVVAVWPKDRFIRILASEGPETALPALMKMVAASPAADADAECRRFAGAIIDAWRPTPRHSSKQPLTGAMFQELARLGDVDLLRRFLGGPFLGDYSKEDGKHLAKIAQQFGWEVLADDLRRFVAHQSPTSYLSSLPALSTILEELCCSRGKMTAGRKSACQALAAELVQAVERWDAPPEKPHWGYGRESRLEIFEPVFRILNAVGDSKFLDQFATHVLSDSKHYDLDKVLIPAIKQLSDQFDRKSAGHEPFQRLLRHCIEALKARTATPVVFPTDWAQDVKLGCKCAHCAELSKFLKDPQERVHRVRARQDLRDHVERRLLEHGCDVGFTTERKGTPHTLVCTKNHASYERRQKAFEADSRLLEELRELLPGRNAAGAKPRKSGLAKSEEE